MRKILLLGVCIIVICCLWIFNWRISNDTILAKHNIHNVPRGAGIATTVARVNKAVERGRETVKKAVYGSENAKYQLIMTATAYSLTRNNTRSGTRPGMGTISVDPKVIPLGARLYVEGYGHGTALDTGREIKGRRLDLWLPSRGAAIRWGRKQVRVHVYK